MLGHARKVALRLQFACNVYTVCSLSLTWRLHYRQDIVDLFPHLSTSHYVCPERGKQCILACTHTNPSDICTGRQLPLVLYLFLHAFAVEYFKESSSPSGIWAPSGWLPLARLQRGAAEALQPKRRLPLPARAVSWRSLSGIEGVRELRSHTWQYCFVELRKSLWLELDRHQHLKSDVDTWVSSCIWVMFVQYF